MLEDGCDPAWGSGTAPDNATLQPREQVGDREITVRSAAHNGIQREEKRGIVQEPLKQGLDPAGVRAEGSTAVASSKVSSSAG